MKIHSKTNLFLHVGKVRPEDNRHELATLFLPLNRLCDELTAAPLPSGSGIKVNTSGREIPDTPPNKNLIFKAAYSFCNTFNVPSDWQFSLKKSIPIAAGLGGGSADAAAALRILSSQFPCDSQKLNSLALSIGADVPFFLQDSPAFATGAGEKLTAIDIPAHFGVIIVFPGFPSTVKWAYTHSPCRESLVLTPPSSDQLSSAESIAALACNDLAIPLLEKFPILKRILNEMKSAGCIAADVSGSGSSCFGICKPGAAPEIIKALTEKLSSFNHCEICHAAEF